MAQCQNCDTMCGLNYEYHKCQQGEKVIINMIGNDVQYTSIGVISELGTDDTKIKKKHSLVLKRSSESTMKDL